MQVQQERLHRIGNTSGDGSEGACICLARLLAVAGGSPLNQLKAPKPEMAGQPREWVMVGKAWSHHRRLSVNTCSAMPYP